MSMNDDSEKNTYYYINHENVKIKKSKDSASKYFNITKVL